MFKIYFFFLITVFSFSQNLTDQRIRKIGMTKGKIYFKKGIFHSEATGGKSILKAIRHSYKSKSKYERVVFDFKSTKAPRVYGHLSSKEKKIYIDFFSTDLSDALASFGKSKFVKKVDFFPVGDELLSAELTLTENLSIDVFHLASPGRLVIDLKK